MGLEQHKGMAEFVIDGWLTLKIVCISQKHRQLYLRHKSVRVAVPQADGIGQEILLQIKQNKSNEHFRHGYKHQPAHKLLFLWNRVVKLLQRLECWLPTRRRRGRMHSAAPTHWTCYAWFWRSASFCWFSEQSWIHINGINQNIY